MLDALNAGQHVRLEMLRVALARVDDLDLALDKARRLEAYVLNGGLSLPAPPVQPPLMPTTTAPMPTAAVAGAPRARSSRAETLKELVFATLQSAALEERPCPTNTQLAATADATINEVTHAFAALAQARRLAVETRGPKRRVCIDRIWTLWTGEQAAPRASCPAPEEHVTPPDNGGAVAAAIAFLRERGCEITWAANAYWHNGEEISAARILEKAARKRAIIAAASPAAPSVEAA